MDSLLIGPIITIPVLVISVVLHEIAHGYVADRLGDPTARLMGRLSLNPIKHLDPMMSILFPILLILSGSPIIFGAAKPVPVDPYNFRNPKKDMGLVATAGPAMFLILAIIGAIIFRILSLGIIPDGLQNIFALVSLNLIQINLMLMFFNLIPIPPLDGSKILAAVLDDNQASFLDNLEPYGFLIVIFLLMFPLPFFNLSQIISNLTSIFLRLLIQLPPSSGFV